MHSGNLIQIDSFSNQFTITSYELIVLKGMKSNIVVQKGVKWFVVPAAASFLILLDPSMSNAHAARLTITGVLLCLYNKAKLAGLSAFLTED
uniref:Uncharacterized protein n=1 Tax=Chenopodium quinoa TaxID=63459 RepID=A0A803LPY3_CHEQI